jgi:MarR family transcriptional regulator, organic hydroperoxide resistance regulator
VLVLKHAGAIANVSREVAVHDGDELAMWLRKGYLAFHRRVNAWMLKYGITADQFVLLRVVGREEGITQIEIVERTASDPNTVTAILRLLEQRDLVRRQPHARDRRARCVFLTVAGRNLQRRAFKDSEPLRAALRDCLTDSKSRQSQRLLQRVHKVFSAPSSATNGRPRRRPSPRKAAR